MRLGGWRRTTIIAVALTVLVAGTAQGSSRHAADPGLYRHNVVVATVATIGGPLPGLLAGAPNGVDAYFAYVNSQGGVYGRKFTDRVFDDQLNCSNNAAGSTQYAGVAFAFVGSASPFNSCSAPVFQSHPGTPVVLAYGDATTQALANVYSAVPAGTNVCNRGPFNYLKAKYRDAISRVGVLVPQTLANTPGWLAYRKCMVDDGFSIVYQRSIPSGAPGGYLGDIINMRQAGVKLVLPYSLSVSSDALVLNTAQQQGWAPEVWLMNTAYDAKFIKALAPGVAGRQNVVQAQTTSLFLGTDKASVAGVRLFTKWLAKTHKGFAPDLYSVEGWVAAKVFVDAFKAAGPKPTQAKVLAALARMKAVKTDGLVAPVDVGEKHPPNCYALIHLTSTGWHRLDTPKGGFRCGA